MSPLLDRLLDASSSGVVVTDPGAPDHPIVYVNSAFEKITGYTAGEVLGRNCRFLQGDDSGQPEIGRMRKRIREGEGCHTVLRNYRKDGTLFWNELHISPVRDETGRLTHFIGVQNDVTGRRRFEDALRKSEERLKLAMGAGRVGLCEWEAGALEAGALEAGAGELTCFEEFAEIFGLAPGRTHPTREELLVRVHPEDREYLVRAQENAIREEDSHETEYRVILPDGGLRWVAEKGRVYRGPGGSPERAIGIIQDITGRKKAEEERSALLERERQARGWAERATRRMFVLEEATSVLSKSLDYDATLGRITGVFVPNLADWCLVDVIDEDGSVSRVARAGSDPGKEHVLHELDNQSRNSILCTAEVSRVLASGQSFLAPSLDTEQNGEGLETLLEFRMYSCMVVPLIARGRTLGAVTLISSDPERRYEKEDLSLAEDLASRCGLALESARLYREQDHVARTLQGGLLLKDLPEIPGVEVGLEYLSVGRESEVGGDFYDLIDTHYDGWLCLLGDVSGKGARAATSTALILYALRAVAFRGDKPSMILSALNGAMLRQESGNQFCTAVCARLEPEERGGKTVKLTLARGGHPPPLLLRADGPVEELGEPGRAIGVFEKLDLQDLVISLEPGDTLFLYTDGVTEARSSDGTFFGEDRLKDLVINCAGLDAAAAAGRLKGAVLEHRGGNPGDDVAILVLKVSGS